MNDPDRLEDKLASLPLHDAPHALAQRTRRQAQAALARRRAHADRPWVATAADLWSRVLMPVALASVVGVYLTWAFAFAGALYR